MQIRLLAMMSAAAGDITRSANTCSTASNSRRCASAEGARRHLQEQEDDHVLRIDKMLEKDIAPQILSP
jgi:hypothetical protein